MRDAGDKLSHGRHFFGMNQLVAKVGGIGDVGHDHHDAGDVSLLVAHGAEVHGELTGPAVSAHDLQFQIVNLRPTENGLKRVGQRTNEAGRRQFQ